MKNKSEDFFPEITSETGIVTGNALKSARRAAEKNAKIGSFLKFLQYNIILEIGVGGWVRRNLILYYIAKRGGWVGRKSEIF